MIQHNIREQQASYKSLWRLNLCRIQPDGDLYPCNRGTPKITPKLTYNSVKWYGKYAGVVFASVALPVLLLLAKYFEETFYTPGVLIWQFILIQERKIMSRLKKTEVEAFEKGKVTVLNQFGRNIRDHLVPYFTGDIQYVIMSCHWMLSMQILWRGSEAMLHFEGMFKRLPKGSENLASLLGIIFGWRIVKVNCC